MTKAKGGYIAISRYDKDDFYIKQGFKGQVMDIPTKFPKGLGAEHPFNFNDLEKLYKKYGVVTETVNKTANEIVTDFEILLQNPNAQALIDSFVKDTNFHRVITDWVREGLLKGNGYIELDLENNKIRVLNTNNMFIKRTRKGKVIEYNQWNKSFKLFDKDSKDLETWKPNEIAHLPINKIPNQPYGIGIIYPNERIIENIIRNEQDLQTIIERKAGAPYHIKVGQPGNIVGAAIVDKVKSKLQFLKNTTEWVTDGDVEISSIPFEGLGKNLTDTQMYFFRQYIAGTGVPEVSFGSGQLNEGIARVQREDRKVKIHSFQTYISDIIEEQIIRPLLIANGLDETPEFLWDLPTEESINERLAIVQTAMASPMTSPGLRAALEIEYAKLMEFEGLDTVLPTPEEAIAKIEIERTEDREREREENIPQPEVPGAKPNANASVKLNEVIRKQGNKWCVFSKDGKNLGCFSTKAQAEKRLAQIERAKRAKQSTKLEETNDDMKIQEFVNIKELAGFNYSDYLVKILQVLKKDKFSNLLAITETDIADGLLPSPEIEKLRVILKDGFKENKTIKEIEKNVRTDIDLKDRVTTTGTIIAASTRPMNITRTETVRLANEGLLDLYNENKIERVRFLAALSERTCPICEGLNGQIFEIKESSGIIPVHSRCRCSWISIIER